MWDLIVSVPDHCLSFYFTYVSKNKYLLYLTGRGSSIGSEFAWHASGPEFDPHVRHIFRGDLVMKTFLRPFSLFR